MTEALDFLLTRRSTPVRTLSTPVPDRAMIEKLLTAAARVPDHGKLVPFRFIVLEKPAIDRLADLTRQIGAAQDRDPDKLIKQAMAFSDAPLTIAVVFSPKLEASIPLIEQEQTSALACLSLVNAALASGFGGHWLTGWMARDREFLRDAFGLEPPELVTGFVHIGTVKTKPPERPRPDINAITTWVEA